MNIQGSTPTFQASDRVRIVGGPFRGIEGTVVGTSFGGGVVRLTIELVGQTVDLEIEASYLIVCKPAPAPLFQACRKAFTPLSNQLVYDLAKHPERLRTVSSRQFEELVAQLMSDMGYDVTLTPETRDGGRDILAYFDLPHGRTLTIVDCKRFAAHRRIGPDIVERLLWVASQHDRASNAMIATTSYFTDGARRLEQEYRWQLSLKDYDAIRLWLNQYGSRLGP